MAPTARTTRVRITTSPTSGCPPRTGGFRSDGRCSSGRRRRVASAARQADTRFPDAHEHATNVPAAMLIHRNDLACARRSERGIPRSDRARIDTARGQRLEWDRSYGAEGHTGFERRLLAATTVTGPAPTGGKSTDGFILMTVVGLTSDGTIESLVPANSTASAGGVKL